MAMGLGPMDFLVRARFEPVPAVLLVVGGAWYVRARLRLRAQGHVWPAARTGAFVLAWLLIAVAEFSGLWAFEPTNFSAFGSVWAMVALAAPALLALSAPLTLAVRSAPRPVRLARMESWAARALANPFTTWMVFTASVFVLFFSFGLLQQATAGGAVQQLVFLWLFLAGWLFFWPLVDVDPVPYRIGTWGRILYLLLTFPVFTIMGMGLESQSGRPLAALSPASLHLGGAVIWVIGETVAVCGSLAVFAQWLRADERRARIHDEASQATADRQMALWRASREAAARAAPR